MRDRRLLLHVWPAFKASCRPSCRRAISWLTRRPLLSKVRVLVIFFSHPEPLLTQDILEYAQRLARYTSAPSSYTLEAQGATLGTSGSAQKADYNPTAARAAGYYDPEIPLMAQELPFPSDRLMRQGILYADASQMVGTAPDVEAQAGVTSPAESTLEETAPPAPLAALDSFAMDDEDAFDLDLNP